VSEGGLQPLTHATEVTGSAWFAWREEGSRTGGRRACGDWLAPSRDHSEPRILSVAAMMASVSAGVSVLDRHRQLDLKLTQIGEILDIPFGNAVVAPAFRRLVGTHLGQQTGRADISITAAQERRNRHDHIAHTSPCGASCHANPTAAATDAAHE